MAKINKSSTSWRAEMVKFIHKALISLLIIFNFGCTNQSKFYYCVNDNRCITLWKKDGGDVYIVPDLYFERSIPIKGYIKTVSTQAITFYFSDSLPNQVIVRNQSRHNKNSGYEIIGPFNNKEFVQYNESYKSILYGDKNVKFNDVKNEVDYIDLVIKENYAINKKGEKINGEKSLKP